MGTFVIVILCIIFFIWLFKPSKKEKQEREESLSRTNSWIGFIDDISEEEFKSIVMSRIPHSPRIKEIATRGPIVYGTVYTQSRLSEWNFEIDFNDYGHITGSYWLSSDNDDSNVPKYIADNIKDGLKKALSAASDIETENDIRFNEPEKESIYKEYKFCPYCGKPVANPKSIYCTSCGKEMHPKR